MNESTEGIIGNCESMRHVKTILARYRSCMASVLLFGESGTGKELVARAIHYSSIRADGPFVPINCGALPDDLLENELFGHEQGAYTGAGNKSTGLVGQADNGTLFLDEIGTLSHKGQCTLLRFLQSKEFRPLGSNRLRFANVRIVAATNANLNEMVSRKEFRRDLLYRLNVLTISLPPLRSRGEDIRLLAEHFIRCFCADYGTPEKILTPAAGAWLTEYHWPGNIRELENTIHRAVLSSVGQQIHLEDISTPLEPMVGNDFSTLDTGGERSCTMSFRAAKARIIDRFEHHYLSALMRNCNGNVSEAARMAGKERRALGKLLKKHGIERQHFQTS